jgi:hypothetical protein
MKAKKEGRLPGINGRPGLTDHESEEVIIDHIIKDADQGVFHDIYWLEQMVRIYIIYFIFFVDKDM